MEAKIKPREIKFCEEYIFDWNATRAYKVAFKTDKDNVAAVNGNKLLRKAKIQAQIKIAQKDLERLAGISKLRIVNELLNTAFSSIANLHNTWVERRAFEDLTEQQKACISELSYETRTVMSQEQPVEIQYVKIKLYDKHKSIEILNKMLGYNLPDELDMNLGLDKERGRVSQLFPTDEEFKEAGE